MTKRFLFFVSISLLSLFSHASEFTEGRHYKVLTQFEKSSNPLLVSYFSFYCPQCLNLKPIIEQIVADLPAEGSFEKRHVSFMGGQMGPIMNKAYATAVSLGVEEEMTQVIFEHLQIKRKPLNNLDDVRQLFIANGITQEQFDSTYSSFVVDSMSNGFDKSFLDSRLRGVPSLVINNQYQLVPNHVRSNEEYIRLAQYLLAK